MNKPKIFIYFQYLLFLICSIFLVYYCYNNFDFNKFQTILSMGNYTVAIWVLLSSVLVYISRIYRWNIILSKVNENISFMNNFSSVAIGYLVSFFFPRGGEVVKCLILKKTDSLTIEKSLIATFFERFTDIIFLALYASLLFVLEYYYQSKLVTNLINPMSVFKTNKVWLILLSVLLIGLISYFVYKKIRNYWLNNIVNHLKELFSLVTNLKFITHSIFIWFNYFLMTYLWFFVFESTSNLTVLQAFQVSLIGAVARSIPLPGGALGAYHAAIAFALTSMNIEKEIALSLGFIIHGFQTLFTFLAGFIGLFWLVIVKKIYRIK